MYGTGGLKAYGEWYAGYHGYVSVAVCVFGIICNIFNILVLTRKNMWSTTNCILTGLAVSDMLTMISYVPFALQFYILHGQQPSPERNSHNWIMFFLFHVNFSVTTHTTSTWLGVLLSVFRYAYVRLSTDGAARCTMTKAKIAVVMTYIWSMIILVPNYLSVTVTTFTDNNTNHTFHELTGIDTATTFGHTVTTINFWIHALAIKIIPCCLMSLFGFLLICTMRTTHRRSQRLRRSSTLRNQQQRRSREHSRTTLMLVMVIILFLLTEFPHGILALLCGLREGFFAAVYVPLGDTMDIIALVNNAINFTLYCSMSKQFRDTFIQLLCPKHSPSTPRCLNGKTSLLLNNNVSASTF